MTLEKWFIEQPVQASAHNIKTVNAMSQEKQLHSIKEWAES